MYNSQLVIERVQSEIKKKNMTQKAVLSECGLGEDTLKRMTNKNGMASFNLARIADYLECSVDYLLGRTKNPKSHADNGKLAGLSDEEQRLIAGYRELNDEGQKQAVIYVTEMLLQNVRYTQKSNSDNVKEA